MAVVVAASGRRLGSFSASRGPRVAKAGGRGDRGCSLPPGELETRTAGRQKEDGAGGLCVPSRNR